MFGDKWETSKKQKSGAFLEPQVVSDWQRAGEWGRELWVKSQLCLLLNLGSCWNVRISVCFHLCICRDRNIRDCLTLGCTKNCMS